MNGIKLISTGSAVPKKVVTNDDLAKIVDTNDEWISTRTGIRSRRYCTDGESHTSLCLAAARQALERGGVAPGEIGICLVATVTPDFLSPAAACLLQKELGFPEDTICFDLNAACSGFVYALHTAECLLASTPRKYGLVLGAEILSRVMDFGDRSTCVLFGDGAGAALVEWGANYPSLHAVLGCRGNSEVLYVPGVNTAAPPHVHMDGQSVFRFAVEAVPRCAREVLDRAGLTPEDIDLFVFHQANQRIIDFAVKKLGIDPATGELAGETAGEQAAQALKNIKHILDAAGTGIEHVCRATIYMKNVEDFHEIDDVYAQAFIGSVKPARVAFGGNNIPKGALVEIDAIAVL